MATNAPPESEQARQQQTQEDAHAEVHRILDQDASKGAVVHKFDPDAPPENKASAAAKGQDKLKPYAVSDNDIPKGKEMPIDTGRTGVVPTITVEDVDQPAEEKRDKASPVPAPPSGPGAYPSEPAPEVPEWYKIGWRSVANVDVPRFDDEQTRDKEVLERFIPEQFYGDWYHNAGIIIFAVCASHFFTRFNFGWGWLFILLAVCCTYYTTSMARVRRCARDDIQRELVKTRLASEHESADWLNNFLDRFWLIYEPVLSKSVVATVDQILSISTPAFLDSLRLSTFTLGTKAPRIAKVRTFPNTEDDVVMMDWNVSFIPNDVSDMTPREAMKKVNPKIVLAVRVGRGLASAAMPILIEDVTFAGLIRIKLKLVSNFPHIQIVDLTFLGKPTFDFVLKPVGGDAFGFDIAHIPGLSEFIRGMVHATLGPMMYDPNFFTLNLEQLLSGVPLDAAIGVVQITVEAARGLKGSKIGGGSPDPYVSVTINNRQELARTKYRNNTYNPTWAETKFILVNTLQDPLVLNVMDYNERRKDSHLGSATFELQKLLDDATIENIELPILKDGKDRGLLRFNLSYYPVLKPEMIEGKEELPNTNVGIVWLTVHQAKELDSTKSLTGDLNPLAKVYLGDDPSAIHCTQVIKHTNNPVWESPIEFLCLDKRSSLITLKVIDDRDILKDPVLGYMSVRLEDLLAGVSKGRDWWPLSGCKSGKIRVSLQWKPLQMAGVLSGVDQYVPPIGVVRLWLQRATDVKNVEAALGGKSDPYVRVLVNHIIKGRTEVINNNLSPEWDQIVYIPVHSLRESMFMEVMDYQHLTKDRSLGSVELHVNELARESSKDTQYRYESIGKEAEDPIKLDGGNGQAYQGRLHYVAEFIPCLHLKNVQFDADENELQQAAKGMTDLNKAADSGGHSPSNEQRDVTIRQPVNDVQREEREGTFANGTVGKVETNPDGDETNDREEISGLELGKEELLKRQSGIIIFYILSGQLHKKARLEVLLDDGYWPAFSTVKARSTHAQWQHIGEAFIKELDFGRVWLRLNESAEGDKDDIIAEWKGNAKPFVDATLGRRCTYTLTNDDDKISTVVIETRYVPVPVKLEPRESINNQGVLRVELIGAKDLRSADRGGKSDPYAVFTLNGQKEFKSQMKKKTLNPEWNETFNVNVSSRVAADFTVEVFDWNQLEQAKSLGIGRIRLDDLEPLEAAERFIPLSSEKHGEKGVVHLRMVFQPEIIARARKSTSTFSVAGRAMTHIGSLPMEAGRGVLQGVGSIFKRDHEKENSLPSHSEVLASATHPTAQSLGSGGAASRSAESLHGASSGSGVLRVVVVNAQGLHNSEAKPYAVVRVGDKEHKTKHGHAKTSTPEWNESFVFPAGPSTSKLYVCVYDHKTLGRDKVLGEGEVEIWRHLQPGQSSVADLSANLREGGQVRLRLEFDTTAIAHVHDPSVTSLERPTTVSPSRFSIRGRRPGATEDS